MKGWKEILHSEAAMFFAKRFEQLIAMEASREAVGQCGGFDIGILKQDAVVVWDVMNSNHQVPSRVSDETEGMTGGLSIAH